MSQVNKTFRTNRVTIGKSYADAVRNTVVHPPVNEGAITLRERPPRRLPLIALLEEAETLDKARQSLFDWKNVHKKSSPKLLETINSVMRSLVDTTRKIRSAKDYTVVVQSLKDTQAKVNESADTLKNHKGWFALSKIFRSILGAVLTLLSLPVLMVSDKARKAFDNTFFTTPKLPKAEIEKLEKDVSSSLEKLQSQEKQEPEVAVSINSAS